MVGGVDDDSRGVDMLRPGSQFTPLQCSIVKQGLILLFRLLLVLLILLSSCNVSGAAEALQRVCVQQE